MNWKTRMQKWHETSFDYPLVLGQPANQSDLDQLSRAISRELPAEWVSLYSCYDGVGMEIDGKASWTFVPIELLPDFISETRDWFEESHPSIAGRFLPFFDWGTGDAVGYLWDENGGLLPKLYEFSHELYEFEEGQHWEEFMIETFDSIEQFIIAITPE